MKLDTVPSLSIFDLCLVKCDFFYILRKIGLTRNGIIVSKSLFSLYGINT